MRSYVSDPLFHSCHYRKQKINVPSILSTPTMGSLFSSFAKPAGCPTDFHKPTIIGIFIYIHESTIITKLIYTYIQVTFVHCVTYYTLLRLPRSICLYTQLPVLYTCLVNVLKIFKHDSIHQYNFK